MLNTVLNETTIRLDVKASDWKEAVQKSCDLLLERGDILQSYVEEIYESVNKYGPYIVVMPGVAFAHAAPSPSVQKNSLSMVRLTTPVNFGSDMNDPVKIVFAIAAKESEQHLQDIQSLAVFLMDEKNVEILMHGDIKEIIESIGKH